MHRDGLGPQTLREGPKAQVSTAKCSSVWVTLKTKSLKSGLLLIQTLAACRVFGEQTLESEGKQAQRFTENKTQLGPKQEHINGPVLGPEARMEGESRLDQTDRYWDRAQKQAPRIFAPGERGETAELTSPL